MSSTVRATIAPVTARGSPRGCWSASRRRCINVEAKAWARRSVDRGSGGHYPAQIGPARSTREAPAVIRHLVHPDRCLGNALSRIHTTHPHMAESPWRTTACGGIMSGQSWIEATAEQRAELRGLAGSSERGEADRARAILLSLDGWTSERISAAFCAKPDSVRHWRWIFGREGVAGLRPPQATRPGAGQGAGCFVGDRGS